MLEPRTGTYFALGAIGSEIWALLVEPTAIGVLCDRLCERFDVDEATCRRDVIEFVQQLCSADLARTIAPGDAA